MGPPGTGKTLLARAVAGEANVPFFHISGSEFVEMFVGVGASRVRDLFATAKKAAPAIIFIDELDAVGRQRGAGLGGGHDEREQTLNQILTEMDGFERDTNVIVTAATNRPDVLDPALLRPGRFDRRVILELPDINDREEILKIHVNGKPLALNVNLREIAERTPGFSGADIANLVNESAIFAARRNKPQIYQEELLESIDKVLLGPERKSHILSEKEKKVAAYHEAGHALVATSLPGAEPIRKISIIARGRAAGYTLKLPIKERHLKTKTEFLAELATLLGAGNAYLDRLYFCPHHPDKGYPEERPEYKIKCTCRKPEIGMLKQAALDMNIDLTQSYIIGDRTVDIETGYRAGMKSILVRTGAGGKDKKFKSTPDYCYNNLEAAIDAIIGNK